MPDRGKVDGWDEMEWRVCDGVCVVEVEWECGAGNRGVSGCQIGSVWKRTRKGATKRRWKRWRRGIGSVKGRGTENRRRREEIKSVKEGVNGADRGRRQREGVIRESLRRWRCRREESRKRRRREMVPE